MRYVLIDVRESLTDEQGVLLLRADGNMLTDNVLGARLFSEAEVCDLSDEKLLAITLEEAMDVSVPSWVDIYRGNKMLRHRILATTSTLNSIHRAAVQHGLTSESTLRLIRGMR